MSQYRIGTVTASAGSPNITGTGTKWVGNVVAGDKFSIPGEGVPYIVGATPVSDTALTLASNYAGTGGSGLSYAITTSRTPGGAEIPYPESSGTQGGGDVDTATIVGDAMQTVEDLIAGMISISVAGSSNVTLTRLQYRYRYIKLTGALTGSINVVVPTQVRGYIIENATTGSYTLTVKTSGGTGVAVTQGTRMPLECDGTNVVQSIASLNSPTFSSPTFTGTTTAAAITASDTIISTKSGPLFQRTGASTAGQYLHIANTTGDTYYGVEGSVAGTLFTGTTAYGTFLYAGNQIDLLAAGDRRATISSAGLAVTGAVSSTGASVVGGATSRTNTQFSVLGANAKATASSQDVASFSSSDANGSELALIVSLTGSATAGNRLASIQSVEQGTAYRALQINPNGGAVSVGADTSVTGAITATTTMKPGGYTVATLPAAGAAGRHAYVTNATAPTYLAALVGGGAVKAPAFDNGVAWVSH